MSNSRILETSGDTVRLPTLPRQVIFLAIGLFSAGLFFVMPYIYAEWLNRNMSETHGLAEIMVKMAATQSDMDWQAMYETRSLRMSGIEVRASGEDNGKLTWLVVSPQPGPISRTIDLTQTGVFDGIRTLLWLMVTPSESQFAIYNGTMGKAQEVRAIASAGVWQEYMLGIYIRIFIAFLGICILFTIFFSVFFRRLMLQSLDDLFVRLYGSAAMGVSNPEDTKSLLASLDAFQDRMRHHVDEQARLAALGAGASFLAHDIRNLLASLQLNAEQLMQLPGEKEQRIGKRLATAIEQSLSLVEWAALYTSDKRDHLDVQRQPLRPIIDDAFNFVRLHDPRRHVQLVNDCLANVEVVAERTLMFRILYNLTLNAVQAMKSQKTLRQIRIRASNNEEACIIRVSDSGPGLPGEGRGSLLMPHMSGARRPDGTGLGLKIVTDLVSWHGGRLDIIHSDGHGTQFQITLPHQAPGAPRDEADGANMASLEGATSSPAQA
jgi:signal transduction histidine kinase